MTQPVRDRYIRNLETLSADDQKVLAGSCVAILGLGGLGGGVCEMLARTGVGELILVDGDRFEASNLNRQILCCEDNLGQFKVDAAARRVGAVNAGVRVQVHPGFFRADTADAVINGANLVVDCLDTIEDRFGLQKAAARLDIPLVSGAIAGVTGQVTVIFPGDPGFEGIYGPEAGLGRLDRGVEQATGNLAHCAMFVAALQVSECLKVLLKKGDLLRNRLLIADLWLNSVDVMTL